MVTGWKHLKSPKKEASMAKTAKVTFIIIFLPTLLHDLAASRQVKIRCIKIFSFFLRSKGHCMALKNQNLWTYQKPLQQTKSEFSFKSYGNAGFKAPPYHWSKWSQNYVFKLKRWWRYMLRPIQQTTAVVETTAIVE